MNKESKQPTILPWHREAAEDIIKAVNPQVAALCAKYASINPAIARIDAIIHVRKCSQSLQK